MTYPEAIDILEKNGYQVGINYGLDYVEIESISTYCAESEILGEFRKLQDLLEEFTISYNLDDLEILIVKK
jgi:hypothetical protein